MARGETSTFIASKGTLYFRDIPKTLRDEFHAQCARRGKSMRTVIIDFLKKYVKEGNSLKGLDMTSGKKNKKG
jgi:hypothetical protein